MNQKQAFTPKQRMLNAYRGRFSDRVAIAPEFWYYYPAKVLGLDMMEFAKYPFHRALKVTFEKFGCEGWGAAFCGPAAPDVEHKTTETWVDDQTVERRTETRTPYGTLTNRSRQGRDEPGWCVERPIKDLQRDLKAWEHLTFAGDTENMDVSGMIKAWEEVGESYLLEAWVGVPFFDIFAGAREGGLEAGVMDFFEHEDLLAGLQERFIEQMRQRTSVMCRKTPFESLAIGCSWSCNSLIGPAMWRRWDKPVIKAVVDEAHRHGRLVHIHFHGKCMETVADFAELGIDCVCPFERPPGGDVPGLEGLQEVAATLGGKVAMNGNVHTVETLIRGTPADVRREVREIMDAFAGNPRLIVGTGDQVGRETPEENLWAMIDEAKRLSPAWKSGK